MSLPPLPGWEARGNQLPGMFCFLEGKVQAQQGSPCAAGAGTRRSRTPSLVSLLSLIVSLNSPGPLGWAIPVLQAVVSSSQMISGLVRKSPSPVNPFWNSECLDLYIETMPRSCMGELCLTLPCRPHGLGKPSLEDRGHGVGGL